MLRADLNVVEPSASQVDKITETHTALPPTASV